MPRFVCFWTVFSLWWCSFWETRRFIGTKSEKQNNILPSRTRLKTQLLSFASPFHTSCNLAREERESHMYARFSQTTFGLHKQMARPGQLSFSHEMTTKRKDCISWSAWLFSLHAFLGDWGHWQMLKFRSLDIPALCQFWGTSFTLHGHLLWSDTVEKYLSNNHAWHCPWLNQTNLSSCPLCSHKIGSPGHSSDLCCKSSVLSGQGLGGNNCLMHECLITSTRPTLWFVSHSREHIQVRQIKWNLVFWGECKMHRRQFFLGGQTFLW